MSNEDRLQEFLAMVERDQNRAKTLVMTKDAEKRVRRVYSKLEFLVKQENINHQIYLSRACSLTQRDLGVEIKTVSFRTNRDTHPLFQDVINEVDSFGIVSQLSKRLWLIFCLDNIYIET